MTPREVLRPTVLAWIWAFPWRQPSHGYNSQAGFVAYSARLGMG